ncbi:chemotaxis protein CheD [Clostridium algidicarnis]|uniref:chemotaxis protein CheD n=1 Tax=Clostridium algidicarnis TaxID=37659 RepID=UPI001C0DEE93|nr:chemotaxis protein CheD [Clostridium algidicarnis]MBU3208882.1 chemotaxis protein CheD [Clostridium algidicarnis]MBU3226608.1 chemotaxis protein CheD [Clostridium algidicarnis]MBU3250481.1 chemotaxis protein CheD [Clostridium algidicarnis]
MESNEVRIGIADLNVVSSPGKIITVGLGSCIGIALYDNKISLGGLAHIMLPDSTQFNSLSKPLKFADLAIPLLLEKMERAGAKKRNIKAKIAGGASMFNFSDKGMINDIGNRNGLAVKASLEKLCIPLISIDIGGNKGRTMILDAESGIVYIRTVGMGTKEL